MRSEAARRPFVGRLWRWTLLASTVALLVLWPLSFFLSPAIHCGESTAMGAGDALSTHVHALTLECSAGRVTLLDVEYTMRTTPAALGVQAGKWCNVRCPRTGDRPPFSGQFDWLGRSAFRRWMVWSSLAVPCVACALATVAAWRPILFCRTRADASRCARCGYDLRASPDRCPECGTDVNDDVSP